MSASRPATSGPTIAPMSAHIENTATAVPARAAGGVADRGGRRRAEERRGHPVRAQRDDQHPDVRGERHGHDRQPGQQPAADHGRPAADGVDEPSGRSEGDGLGHRGAGEGDPGPGRPAGAAPRRPAPARATERTPNDGPALGEVGQAGRLVARVASDVRSGTASRPASAWSGRARRGLQQQQPDRAGHRQGAGVEEEGRGQRDRRTAGRRPPGRSSRRSGTRPGRSRRPGRAAPASTELSSRVNADTVNIAEPMPPTPRSTSSWA